jgi:hypothetical protein
MAWESSSIFTTTVVYANGVVFIQWETAASVYLNFVLPLDRDTIQFLEDRKPF